MAVVDLRELLENAEKQLQASDWMGACDSLLAAWRALRAPEIAEVLEALSARAAKGKTVTARTQTERVVTWTKMFEERTALGLGVLIADLDAAWSDSPQPRFLQARIEALATVRDDPRVASALLRSLGDLGYGDAWNRLLVRCARGLEAAGDPHIIARLEERLKKTDYRPNQINPPWGAKTVASLRKRMKVSPEQQLPFLPDSLRPLVESMAAFIRAIPRQTVIDTPPRAKPEGADPAALLNQVRESPDDDDLRLILADALDAVGDPLGELIVLQTRRANGESTPKTIARERALLKANMRTWLGPIATAVKLKSAVFERGFLTKCDAVVRRQVEAEIQFQHAEWATVRSITFEDEARITPSMRSLREAWNIDEHALRQLVEHGHPKLEKLSLNHRATDLPNLTTEFARCSPEKFPALTHFQVGGYIYLPSQTSWVWTAQWANQLRSFGVGSHETTYFLNVFTKRKHLEQIVFDRRSGFRIYVTRATEAGGGFDANLVFDEIGMSGYVNDAFQVINKITPLYELVINASKLKPKDQADLRKALDKLKPTIKVRIPLSS